jgi:hypothetical protein
MRMLRWLRQGYARFAPAAGVWLPITGILALLVAGGFALRSWNYARHRVRAVATVTENLPAFVSGGGMLYYPRVRFRDTNGALVLVLTTIGSGDVEFEPGTTLPVLYRAGDAQHAEIATAWRAYFGAIVWGILGTVLFDVGLLVVLMGRRRTAMTDIGSPID